MSRELAESFFRSATEAFAFTRDYGATAAESLEVWDGTDFQPTRLADLGDRVWFAAQVQYAAPGWTAHVTYDNRDFLINTALHIAGGAPPSLLATLRVAIEQRLHPANYSLWEWINALGADAAGASHSGGVDTADRVAAGVHEMADVLRTYLPAILREAATLTPRVRARRDARMRRWQEQGTHDRDRRAAHEADAAFHRRDFQRVVELLEPLEPRLTGVDRQKLSYARRRIASAGDT